MDIVNRPPHYTFAAIEVIDVIEYFSLGYHLGNAVKYLARAGKKNPEKEKEDVAKAVWYLNRYCTTLNNIQYIGIEADRVKVILADWKLKPEYAYAVENILLCQQHAKVLRLKFIENAILSLSY